MNANSKRMADLETKVDQLSNLLAAVVQRVQNPGSQALDAVMALKQQNENVMKENSALRARIAELES